MSKKSGTSWFTAVKRVLWSASKDSNKKSIHRTREEYEYEHEHQKDTDKKREKRGWMFRKTKLETINSVTDNIGGGTTPTAEIKEEEIKPVAVDDETVIKLNASPGFIRGHWAAIIIQTAFRSYLARRALRALKGIVKLQALVRGNNVRNQAKLTLRCIKALVRVQDQVLHHQRSRVSSSTSILEARRNSMFVESNNSFWDTKTCLQDIRCRRSLSRDMSSCTNEWDDRLVNPEDTQLILQRKLEVALKREKAQALAYSNQIRSRSYRNPSAGEETELVERTKWLDRWMATKQWDDTITNSTTCEQYKIKVPIKTLEIDTNITSTHQRFTTVSHSIPATPPSCKAARPVGLKSGSPRVSCSPSVCPRSPLVQPNYMTATESAKARARPQSTPRRRPVGTVKKRLCYAEEERGYEYLRSPSFKSAYNGCLWGDHESDYSCCYGGRYAAGEISPCSTSDLRWLK